MASAGLRNEATLDLSLMPLFLYFFPLDKAGVVRSSVLRTP